MHTGTYLLWSPSLFRLYVISAFTPSSMSVAWNNMKHYQLPADSPTPPTNAQDLGGEQVSASGVEQISDTRPYQAKHEVRWWRGLPLLCQQRVPLPPHPRRTSSPGACWTQARCRWRLPRGLSVGKWWPGGNGIKRASTSVTNSHRAMGNLGQTFFFPSQQWQHLFSLFTTRLKVDQSNENQNLVDCVGVAGDKLVYQLSVDGCNRRREGDNSWRFASPSSERIKLISLMTKHSNSCA